MNASEMTMLSVENIASICDHTFLERSESFRKVAGVGQSPVRLREQALDVFLKRTLETPLKPYAICVRSEDCAFVKSILEQYPKPSIKLAATVGFPDGAWYRTSFKLAETQLALDTGANEIDMVLNYDALKKGDVALVLNEMTAIANVVRQYKGVLKVILETSELTDKLIIQACQLADDAGADFVKTSTGFGGGGAKEKDLALMREHFPRGIKISGGVSAQNVYSLLHSALLFNTNRTFPLDPLKIRIGESSLLDQLTSLNHSNLTPY